MRLAKPPLIAGYREWVVFLAIAGAVALIMLGVSYHGYRNFTASKKLFIDADVLIQYDKQKKGRSYRVFKLQLDNGLTIYTTSREPLKNLQGRRVRLLLFPSKVSFTDYLSTPYVPSVVWQLNPERSARLQLFEMIAEQHGHSWMQELYGALFLALPISKALREQVTLLGLNHLIALSGFHAGLLWAVLYGLLLRIYRPFWQRYFPYRSALQDVGALSLLLLGGYLVLVGIPPSLLRAYAMLLIGWFAVLTGIELISFSFLAVAVIALLALLPALALSIGFWLSVSGVFLIYLWLRWTGDWPRWLNALMISVWVYAAMLPFVHTLFPVFSAYQLLSPVVSLLFVVYYPLEIFLHLLGFGGVTDGWILRFLQWPSDRQAISVTLPFWTAGIYVVLLIFAARYRRFFYLLGVLLLGFLLFMVNEGAKLQAV